MKDSLSLIATCAPVNETAARVVSRSNEAGPKWKMFENRVHLDAPKKTTKSFPKSDGFIDYTGRAYGRLKVVGWTGTRWLVRCVCGRYEERTSKAVRGQSEIDCCTICDQLKQARKRCYFDANGKWPPDGWEER